MRIAAIVGVKNESELIERSVRHLWSIGVDRVFACDVGSTDGTVKALRAMSSDGPLEIIRGDPEEASPFAPSMLEVVRQSGADWVLFQDADEFWLPASGTLRDWPALRDADVASVRRFNVPLTSNGPLLPKSLSVAYHDRLFLYARVGSDDSKAVGLETGTPWIKGAAIMPKVIARVEAVGSAFSGGHDVVARGGGVLRRFTSSDAIIVHVPFTTFERFELKVASIADFQLRHPEFFEGDKGWHWARWVTQWHAGLLKEEFDRQVVSQQLVRELIQSGSIRSASSLLQTMSEGGRAA